MFVMYKHATFVWQFMYILYLLLVEVGYEIEPSVTRLYHRVCMSEVVEVGGEVVVLFACIL